MLGRSAGGDGTALKFELVAPESVMAGACEAGGVPAWGWVNPMVPAGVTVTELRELRIKVTGIVS